MSDLFQDEIDRLNRTQNLVLSLIAREQKAADALEAAEAELARLEHQLQQAEEATSAAYKDAETAEAKLAAIDALHHHCTDGFTNDWCAADAEVWPCRTHRILHPEEEQ